MEIAIEYNTGIEVLAQNASPLKRYICKCGREVILAQGGLIRPYFRHMYDSKALDCDKYLSGYSGSGGWNTFNEKKWKIRLYASIEMTGSSQNWKLELFVPQGTFQGYDGCHLEIPLAYPRPMRIPIANSMHDLSVKVFPQDEDYGIRLGKKIITIPGLSADKINVFRCTEGLGKKLDNGEPLMIGETYLLIFKDSAFPLKSGGFNSNILPSYHEWNARILSIPINPENELRTWCHNVLKRSVCLPGLRMRVLSPMESERNIDGSFDVPADTPILIGVYGVSGQYVSPLLGIKHLNYEEAPKWIKLYGELPLVFKVDRLKPGEYGFILKEENDCSLLLNVKDGSKEFSLPGISLLVQNRENEQISRNIPLMSEEIASQVTLIRNRKAVIKSFQIPYEARLRVEFYIKGKKGIEKQIRTYANKTTLMDEDVSLYIQAIFIVMDGGNFGSVYLNFDSENRQDIIPVLAPNLRSKINWLIQKSRSQRSLRSLVYMGTELKYLSNIVLENEDDNKLIRSFLRIEFWPIQLIHHVLSVLKTIKTSQYSTGGEL